MRNLTRQDFTATSVQYHFHLAMLLVVGRYLQQEIADFRFFNHQSLCRDAAFQFFVAEGAAGGKRCQLA